MADYVGSANDTAEELELFLNEVSHIVFSAAVARSAIAADAGTYADDEAEICSDLVDAAVTIMAVRCLAYCPDDATIHVGTGADSTSSVRVDRAGRLHLGATSGRDAPPQIATLMTAWNTLMTECDTVRPAMGGFWGTFDARRNADRNATLLVELTDALAKTLGKNVDMEQATARILLEVAITKITYFFKDAQAAGRARYENSVAKRVFNAAYGNANNVYNEEMKIIYSIVVLDATDLRSGVNNAKMKQVECALAFSRVIVSTDKDLFPRERQTSGVFSNALQSLAERLSLSDSKGYQIAADALNSNMIVLRAIPDLAMEVALVRHWDATIGSRGVQHAFRLSEAKMHTDYSTSKIAITLAVAIKFKSAGAKSLKQFNSTSVTTATESELYQIIVAGIRDAMTQDTYGLEVSQSIQDGVPTKNLGTIISRSMASAIKQLGEKKSQIALPAAPSSRKIPMVTISGIARGSQ